MNEISLDAIATDRRDTIALSSEPVIGMFVRVEPDVRCIRELLANITSDSIPNRPDLAVLQTYIRRMVHIRGFDKESLRDVVLLLIEEVGELAKAVRKRVGLKIAATDPEAHKSVAMELADCLIRDRFP